MEQLGTQQNPRKINKFKYIAVFALATLIFFAGLALGLGLTKYQLGEIQQLEEKIKSDIASAEVEYMLLAQNPCNPTALSLAAERLDDIGNRLAIMESKLGKRDILVLRLAEYYSLLEIRHWLLMQKVNAECSNKFDIILFFYSNVPEACPDCESQGLILSALKAQNPDVYIYSFNVDIDSPALNTLKKLFQIEHVPTLIINKEKFEGLRSLEEIKHILKQQSLAS